MLMLFRRGDFLLNKLFAIADQSGCGGDEFLHRHGVAGFVPGPEKFNAGCGYIAQLHIFFHPRGIDIILILGQIAVHQFHENLLPQGTVFNTNQIPVPNRQSAQIPVDICQGIPEFMGLLILNDPVDFLNQIPQKFLLQSLNGIIVGIEGFSVDACQFCQFFDSNMLNISIGGHLLKGIVNGIFGTDRSKIRGGYSLHRKPH